MQKSTVPSLTNASISAVGGDGGNVYAYAPPEMMERFIKTMTELTVSVAPLLRSRLIRPRICRFVIRMLRLGSFNLK